GPAAGARNVIAGNGQGGVVLQGSTTSDNLVAGNYIGTDASGTVAVGNVGDGADIADGATDNTIGGTSAAARNVISGNGGSGVALTGGGDNHLIAGDYIGLASDCPTAVRDPGGRVPPS